MAIIDYCGNSLMWITETECVEIMARDAIIIADAGATKTQWLFFPSENSVSPVLFTTNGINASISSSDVIAETIRQLSEKLFKVAQNEKVCKLFFYGAGCNSDYVINRLDDIFSANFCLNLSHKEYASDLEGAARALFHNEPGTACILGTGSASGIYDGKTLIAVIPSLGYVLGDEGSGAFMGKQLLNLYYKNGLSEKTKVMLESEMKITLPEIIDNVYRKSRASKYLSSFVPFLKTHEFNEDISQLIDNSFKLFFKKNVLQYSERPNNIVRFVGSVASIFSDRLKKIAEEYGLKADSFIQNPIFGLGEFYKKLYKLQ